METWAWIISWIFTIFTVIGNGFVILLVCWNRHLRTKTNAFVISLAVADFFLGLTTVPSHFFCELASWCEPIDHFLPMMFTRVFFQYSSGTNLCGLVIERYLAVVRPLKYLSIMRRSRVIQIILLSWAIPALFIVLVSLLRYRLETTLALHVTGWLYMIFEVVLCVFLLFYLTSMLCVVFKQGHAIRRLAKQLRFNHRLVAKTQGKSAVKMMTIAIGVFLICYGIYLKCSLVMAISKDSSCDDFNYKLPILILNSAVNPLAYALFKRDIKEEFKKIIRSTL